MTGSFDQRSTTTSRPADELQRRAGRVMPGGVASVNRLVSEPLYIVGARGAEIEDASGRVFVDYNCAFGATILGHADPLVAERVARESRRVGLVGLGGTDVEVELAERLVGLIPCAEQVAFVNSGSEATFHALRLARAVTGREKIVKFQGAYHGWHDAVALNVASDRAALGRRDPLGAGMLASTLDATLVARFNDLEGLRDLFDRRGAEIAAVIVEPILHNVGCVAGTESFLRGARELCDRHGAVLVFDEVITGFRHGLGGYQEIVGVTPHLGAFGKALANGFPIAALVGEASLLEHFSPRPTGDVYLAGTYNGHPVMVAAALATLDRLEEPGTYERLYALGARYRHGLDELVARHGLPARASGFGSVWLLEFLTGTPSCYEDLLANDSRTDAAFRKAMLERGHITSTTPLKRWNVTLAHTDDHRTRTLEAADAVLAELARA